MKTLIVTNYDVSRTVNRVGWFRRHKYFEITMTVLTRQPILDSRVLISGIKFLVLNETQANDFVTGEPLFSTVLQQIGHTHKRLNKYIFQYKDIGTAL